MALGVLAAHAIPFEEARREALFLTDKMAYELNVNEAQYEALYEINLDYLMFLSSSRDVKGTHLNRRNYDINCVLTPMQYSKFYKGGLFLHTGKMGRRSGAEGIHALSGPLEDVPQGSLLLQRVPRKPQLGKQRQQKLV